MRAIDYAKEDWKAEVGEHDRASLDPIFAASGWSPRAPRAPEAVPHWCGFSVSTWLQRAGKLHVDHRKSFLHVDNIEAFFTYGARKNVNPKRLKVDGLVLDDLLETQVWHALESHHEANNARRVWLGADTIRALGASFTPEPDDVVNLFAGKGDEGDKCNHTTLVYDYDAKKRLMVLIEGNARTIAYKGGYRSDAVGIRRYDLTDDRVLKRIYGLGRVSPLDGKDGPYFGFRTAAERPKLS